MAKLATKIKKTDDSNSSFSLTAESLCFGFRVLCAAFILAVSFQFLTVSCFARQNKDLEFSLDVNSRTSALPAVYRPNIDLSGRGFYRDATWPQQLAAKEVLDTWKREIGFNGIYRLQYNLWEIRQFAKNRDLQNSLLRNYESIIKEITDAGGAVILDIFGMPAGLGRVLDKRSYPKQLKAFKALVKQHIRRLSCQKRYNIWYEVWNSPDLDNFFLGRTQEYLILYRQVAEAVKELEAEYKIHIPVGGPGISWWFQNSNGNAVTSPEHSLIYALIRYCYRNRLPLDFITWHGFSSDPRTEQQMTIYKKPSVKLIREWLSYFRFAKDTHLIIDEWNYDDGVNFAQERDWKSYIAASYIPARLKSMHEAGLDYQLYFSLEDFQNNKEGVTRNTGIFWFDPASFGYEGGPKSIYKVFKMLSLLGKDRYDSSDKLKDEFVGLIATREEDEICLLIYNYVDPELAINYISRNIGSMRGAYRKSFMNLVKNAQLDKIMQGELDIDRLRLHKKTKSILRELKELNDQAERFKSSVRNLKLEIENLQGNYLYQKYTLDLSCSRDCPFSPVEEQKISLSGLYQETLSLSPYSVNLIVLKPAPKEEVVVAPMQEGAVPAHEDVAPTQEDEAPAGKEGASVQEDKASAQEKDFSNNAVSPENATEKE